MIVKKGKVFQVHCNCVLATGGPNRFVRVIFDKHFPCTVEEGFKLVDADGNRSTRGQGLLIYKGGTVCDRNFGTTAAKAICREMG